MKSSVNYRLSLMRKLAFQSTVPQVNPEMMKQVMQMITNYFSNPQLTAQLPPLLKSYVPQILPYLKQQTERIDQLEPDQLLEISKQLKSVISYIRQIAYQTPIDQFMQQLLGSFPQVFNPTTPSTSPSSPSSPSLPTSQLPKGFSLDPQQLQQLFSGVFSYMASPQYLPTIIDKNIINQLSTSLNTYIPKIDTNPQLAAQGLLSHINAIMPYLDNVDPQSPQANTASQIKNTLLTMQRLLATTSK